MGNGRKNSSPKWQELYRMAQVLMEKGEERLALKSLKQALDISGNEPLILLTLANLCALRGDYEEAALYYQKTISTCPNELEPYLNFGTMLIQIGESASALPLLKKALELAPDDFNVNFQVANALKSLDRTEESINFYIRALQKNPDHPMVCDYLGLALLETKRFKEAVSVLGRARQLNPNNFRVLNNLGLALDMCGELEAARIIFQELTSKFPLMGEGYFNLGNVLFKLGRFAEAVAPLEKAAKMLPKNPAVFHNLGVCLQKLGRWVEAVNAFQKALSLSPQDEYTLASLGQCKFMLGEYEKAAEYYRLSISFGGDNPLNHYNLGIALNEAGKPEEAVSAFKRTLERQPDNKKAWNNLGLAYEAMDRMAEAYHAYEHAIRLDPCYAEAYSNIGNAYLKELKFSKAVAAYTKAIELNPNDGKFCYNLGCCYHEMMQLDKAKHWLTKATKLDPNLVEAHWNLSHVLLLRGELEKGFELYQWRWKRKETPMPHIELPLWNGEPHAGQSIMIMTEQGLGDSLQFIRYLPQVQRLFSRVVLACDRSLQSLFSQFKGVEIIDKKLAKTMEGKVDTWIPLLNLPHVFKTTLTTIPAQIPYIRPRPEKVAKYADLFHGIKGYKVAIVWKGNPSHKKDHERSCSLYRFASLFTLEGMNWFSLQKGESELHNYDFPLIDLGPHLDSFEDTAALLAHMDLLITVDTSVAHLAGAMGIETWILLPFVPDWRWLASGEATRWYPSARLFRQDRSRSWTPVFNRLHEEIQRRFRLSSSH